MKLLAELLRLLVVLNCVIGAMYLIPFHGTRRLHPMLWPAMMLFGFYDVTVIVGEIQLRHVGINSRLVASVILSAGVAIWGMFIERVASGKKTRVWPFNYFVKAYMSPTEVWRGMTQIYRNGVFDDNGLTLEEAQDILEEAAAKKVSINDQR